MLLLVRAVVIASIAVRCFFRFLLCHAFDMHGDHQVFLSWNDEDRSLRDPRTDLLYATGGGLIERYIDIDAEAGEAAHNIHSRLWIMFTDATSKHDRIESAQQPAEATDGLGNAPGKDLQCKSRALISFVCRLAHGLYIILHAT